MRLAKHKYYGLKEDFQGLTFFNWAVQYGQEERCRDEWKCFNGNRTLSDKMRKLTLMLKRLEENSGENGFISKDQVVEVGFSGDYGFKMDDPTVYSLFMIYLVDMCKKNCRPMNDYDMLAEAIKLTCKEYFGKTTILAKEKVSLRFKHLFKSEGYEYPSIKTIKEKGVAGATELSALSHNLWLLAGKKSYFVTTKMTENPSNEVDARSFVIVEDKGKFKMFDLALGEFGELERDPIETLKNNDGIYYQGQYLVIPDHMNESEM